MHKILHRIGSYNIIISIKHAGQKDLGFFIA